MTTIKITVSDSLKIEYDIGGCFPLEIRQCRIYANGSIHTNPEPHGKMLITTKDKKTYLINLFNDCNLIAYRTMRLRHIIKQKYTGFHGSDPPEYIKSCIISHLCRNADENILKESEYSASMCKKGLRDLYEQCKDGANTITKKEYKNKIMTIMRMFPLPVAETIADYFPDTYKYKPKPEPPKAFELIKYDIMNVLEKNKIGGWLTL